MKQNGKLLFSKLEDPQFNCMQNNHQDFHNPIALNITASIFTSWMFLLLPLPLGTFLVFPTMQSSL